VISKFKNSKFERGGSLEVTGDSPVLSSCPVLVVLVFIGFFSTHAEDRNYGVDMFQSYVSYVPQFL
jgi:hypothetical protein